MRKSFLAATAILLVPLSTFAVTNTCSVPVGFVRINVETNGRVLASVPFLPFDPSVKSLFFCRLAGAQNESRSSVFFREPGGPTNAYGLHRIMKWDPAGQFAVYAVKVHGSQDEGITNEVWYADLEERTPSEMTFLPGEAFCIENQSDTAHSVFLCGQVVLDESVSLPLLPGFNLFSYPYSTSKRLIDAAGLLRDVVNKAGGDSDEISKLDQGRYWFLFSPDGTSFSWQSGSDRHAADNLRMGTGYWYQNRSTNQVTWTEDRPYADLFPGGGPPCVVAMQPNDSGTELSLSIVCSGDQGERLDIFCKDVGPTNRFLSAPGWKLADANIPAPGRLRDRESAETLRPILGWTDAGVGVSTWPKVSKAFARYYLVGRADIDADKDGIPDAREQFIFGTDSGKSDTDGDGMPDGWELRNRLDPLKDDAAVDLDGDGKTNLEEYHAGTPPQHVRHKATIIYVDCNLGDDTYAGFSRTVTKKDGPKRTVKGAFNIAIPGDTVLVNEGVYYEGAAVPKGVRMSARGRVVFAKQGEK